MFNFGKNWIFFLSCITKMGCGNVSFILGGRVTTKCTPLKKIQWVEQMDKIAKQINWLNNQIDDIIESIKETSFENYRLEMYLGYINEECNGEIIQQKTELNEIQNN